MKFRRDLVIAQESNTAMQQETEVVVYGLITEPEGLKQADHVEHHLQYEGKFVNDNRCRVRQTTVGDQVTHTLTLKVKDRSAKATSNSMEYNLDIDEVFFTGFTKACDSYQDKTRYVFKSKDVSMVYGDGETVVFPEVLYEVDVFKGPDGDCEWCKVDVELNSIIDHLEKHNKDIGELKLKIKVSHLPIGLKNFFMASTATDEQQKLLDILWGERFKRPTNEGSDDGRRNN